MKAFTKRGFSMIELIIMIAIGSILFTGFIRGVQDQIRNVTLNRNYLIALNLAKREMAKINNQSYPSSDVAEAALSTDAVYPSFVPTWTVTTVDTSGSNTLRQITVRVRLNSVTGNVLIRLDAYRSNIVSFGNGSS